MMRGMGNMQGMMKQVQKMQKEMTAAQAALNVKEFKATSVNDLVKVTMNGERKLVDLVVDPTIIDPEDAEMMQDLILTTVNEALAKVEAETAATMGKYTQGMPGF